MKIKVTEPKLMNEYGVGNRVSFLIDNEHVAEVRHLMDEFSEGFLCLEIDKWREQRSLSANAYFHVLVGKLAAKMGTSSDEMKKTLVQRYGTIGRGSDGKYAAVKVPASVDIDAFYPYTRWFGREELGNVTLEHYFLLKPTHTLDSAEMARLIDGTISECKAVGIETLTPAELERMMTSWHKA